MSRSVKKLVFICIYSLLHSQLVCGQNNKYMPGSYYLIRDDSDEKLIKVRMLGEFDKPGVYLVSRKSKVIDVLAYAGGLTKDSNGEITMSRGKSNRFTESFQLESSLNKRVTEGDLLYAKKSWKAHAPVYLQILTTVLSLATFAVVVSSQK